MAKGSLFTYVILALDHMQPETDDWPVSPARRRLLYPKSNFAAKTSRRPECKRGYFVERAGRM